MARQGSEKMSLVMLALTLLGTHVNGNFLQPFELDEVALKPGSLYHKAMSLNTEYMLMLDVEDLLHTFKLNAKLPSSGNPYVGSWEDPGCEVRGQFMGHYLSALAMLGKHTGNVEVTDRSNYIVAELKKVQDALGYGYLSAFPTEHFDRLRRLQPVWAPFYVIHKIMAGLLDQYTFRDNHLALQMVMDEAAFFLRYIDDTVAVNGTAHWYLMLNNEFGGMNEVMINLYDITKDPEHLRMANMFIKPVFWQPLVKLEDPLAGIHANTHLAQVNGFAAKYEKVGDESSLTAVSHFFKIVSGGHSFATGGSNDHEYWGPPMRMGDAVLEQAHATETQETCTQYNILKIARYLFRWTGLPAYADFYERAILNGLIGTQRTPAAFNPSSSVIPSSSSVIPPSVAHQNGSRTVQSRAGPRPTGQAITIDPYREDWRQAAFAEFPGPAAAAGSAMGGSANEGNNPGPGVLLYLMPMGSGQNKGGSSHGWGFPLQSFWCCYGTSVESFVKLADSIFFYRLPAAVENAAPEVYVTQFVPAKLSARQLGVEIEMDTATHGHGFVARSNLTFGLLQPGAKSVELSLHLRIPSWALPSWQGTRVLVNGETWKKCGDVGGDVKTASPGSFCIVKRHFKSGDVVHMELPMAVYTEAVEDDRPKFYTFQSVMMGPHVMAALTQDDRTIEANPADVASLVTEMSDDGELVTLRAASDSNLVLRHEGRSVSAGPARALGGGMAATFRIKRQLPHRSDAWAGREVPATIDDVVTFESMDMPGFFLGPDDSGYLVLQNLHKPDRGDSYIGNHSFHLTRCSSSHEDKAGTGRCVSFMPLPASSAPAHAGSPGVDVRMPNLAGNQEGEDRMHLSQPAWKLPSGTDAGRRLRADAPPGGINNEQPDLSRWERGFSNEQLDLSQWELRTPEGIYPEGAKLLSGADRQYIIAPLGNIVEEKYSPYLEWVNTQGRGSASSSSVLQLS